jgi:hypothetical protein
MATTRKGLARERMLAALANHPGALDLPLRRAIQQRASVLGPASSDHDELPEPLRAYVDKVARHAYKVTDEDIEGLQRSYSTRQIYEATVAAAVGASLARREAALALLHKGATS